MDRDYYTTTERSAHPIYGGGISDTEARTNAELIVRAVNSHADLVSALNFTLTQLDSLCQWCEFNKVDFRDARKTESYAIARAELAKEDDRT